MVIMGCPGLSPTSQITTFCLLLFPCYIAKCHQTDTTKLDKRFYREEQKQWFGEKVQYYKAERGLQFMKFDFVAGHGQEIKNFALKWYFVFFFN